MTVWEESNKVLIINPYPIDADCPIGIMMGNLFSEFKSDCILQYYTNDCNIDSNSKFKSKKIRLRPGYTYKIKKTIKSLLKNDESKVLINSDRKLRNTGTRNNNWKIWIDLMVPSVLDREVIDEISMFKPDVIYTQVYSYSMLKLITKISKKFSCPIVVHTLDDWMGSHNRRGIISYIPTYYFNKILEKVLNNGRIHMVASPKMKKYMKNRYGGNYRFVMNCCNYVEMRSHVKRSNPLKIVYTGGLMLERFIALDEVSKILKSINNSGIKFEMHVYAPNSHVGIYRNKMQDDIIFHDNVEHNEIINVLLNADVLIHVESFNPNVINFTRYSLSTKIPEYLSSAKPLIYYGPQNIGVAEFLSGEGIGICIDSSEKLKKVLENIYNKYDYYADSGENGFNKGKLILSKKIMKEKISSCLRS